MAKTERERIRPSHFRVGKGRISAVVLLACLLLAFTALGGTLAYIFTSGGQVDNTFLPVEVSCKVDEVFDGITKENVRLQNTGEAGAYLRAAVVVNWCSKTDGSICAEVPQPGRDYVLTVAAQSGWQQGSDGYWYYTKPVESGEFTEILIQSCTIAETAVIPDGCRLSVEIAGSAIQKDPTSVVQTAWGVQIAANGEIERLP